MSYAIIRNTKYKRENLKGIFRHNERRNRNYSNNNIDKEKSYLNYSLKEPQYSYEKEFDRIREKYNLKGQIKTVSNIACEYIITSDKEFFETIGEEETKRYFETAYKFVSEYKNLGEQYILSAKVHMDEQSPHIHLIFLPVVHTKDKKGNDIDKLACSEFWKAKDSYRQLQNAFYDYMVSNGFELERGLPKEETGREHIDLKEYKEITNFEKTKETLKNIKLDQNTLMLSNRYVAGYRGYINVEATDQYGDDFALNNESVQITGTNAYAVKYDEINDRIIVDPTGMTAGTYSYTMTVTAGSHKATTGFNVVVQTPPENGAVTYKIDMDQPVVDMALKGTENDLVNAKTVNIRLAQYKGGIFYDYVYIQSATIKKGDLYYTTDLTKTGTSIAGSTVSGTTIPVTTVSLNKNVATKAQTGVYAIELKFYAGSNTAGLATVNGYLEVTDSQIAPEIAVEQTIASASCTTALDLAKNCLSVAGVSGEIVECTVTGTNTSGSAYKLATKESVNIKSVTVQTTMTLSDGTKVVSNYEISVGKTLKNL